MSGGLGEIVILADDLSGAAETAAALAPGTPHGVAVLLATAHGLGEPIPRPVAIDTDTRSALPDVAFRVVTEVASAIPRDRLLVKKVDSLLRGNVAAELSALTRSGRTVVLAPSLPRLNRVLRDGRPLVDGAPLGAAPAWRLEPTAAPASLLDVLPGAVPLPLPAIREGNALMRVLRDAEAGTLLVCDAETDADLDRIAAAALEVRRDGRGDVTLAGSSALAAAVARLLGGPEDGEVAPGAVPADGRATFVLGTGEPQARAQVDELRARGARVLALDPHALLGTPLSHDLVAAARTAVAEPVSVLVLDSGVVVDPPLTGLLCRRLAELVATVLAGSPPDLLALAGGQTARTVLAALDVSRLTVRGTVNGGAALSSTDTGMTVVTRPGSFGEADDLVRILERVAPRSYATLRA